MQTTREWSCNGAARVMQEVQRLNIDEAVILSIAILAIATMASWGSGTFSESPVGHVIATLAGTAVDVTFDAQSATAPLAVANGDSVMVSIPVHYSGEGTGIMTVSKPAGYTGGTNWTLLEANDPNQPGTEPIPLVVEDLGAALSWNANLARKNATLTVMMPAPMLLIESIEESKGSYAQRVRVDAEYHVDNVTAITSVSDRFSSYKLYELGANKDVDRSEQYHLTFENGVMQWHGFGLSSRRFLLVADPASAVDASQNNEPSAVSAGSEQGTTNSGTADATLDPNTLPRVTVPAIIEFVMYEGDKTQFNVTVHNTGVAGTINVSGPSFLRMPRQIPVAQNETTSFAVEALALSAGNWSGRIQVTNGITTQQTLLRILVSPHPYVERPESQLEFNTQTRSTRALTIVLSLAISCSIGYLIFLLRFDKRRATQ